jgi:hypothetical protein
MSRRRVFWAALTILGIAFRISTRWLRQRLALAPSTFCLITTIPIRTIVGRFTASALVDSTACGRVSGCVPTMNTKHGRVSSAGTCILTASLSVLRMTSGCRRGVSKAPISTRSLFLPAKRAAAFQSIFAAHEIRALCRVASHASAFVHPITIEAESLLI